MRKSADRLELAECLLWFIGGLKGRTKTLPEAAKLEGVVARGQALVGAQRHGCC